MPRETLCYYLRMSSYTILTNSEILLFVAKNTDWRYDGGKLKADYKLPDFLSAVSVINKVALKAEELNHHPSLNNEYNKLSFSLCTHDAENKVTSLDIDLAIIISVIVSEATV